MKHIRSAIVIALVLVIGLVGNVSAHTASSDCQSITLARAPSNSTADVKSGSTVILNDVPGNGTYAIAAGVYSVAWSDGYKISFLEVTKCPDPSPTPTPTPSASPSPTPTPTPVPSPSAEPSRCSSCARPTAPPTDTGSGPTVRPEDQPPTPIVWIVLGLAFLAGPLYAATRPEQTRRRRRY